MNDTYSNPAPLGLLAFGMTTVLLNIHNAGFYGMNSMILAMGIFYGGIAQVIAGSMEFKKKNTFGTLAFTSYGFFWLSLVAMILLPKFGIAEATDSTAKSAYLAVWGVFTALLFIGTIKTNIATMIIFGSLTILFALLSIGDALENKFLIIIAGYEGIFCGLSAMYTGIAQVLNEMYNKTIFPLGTMKK